MGERYPIGKVPAPEPFERFFRVGRLYQDGDFVALRALVVDEPTVKEPLATLLDRFESLYGKVSEATVTTQRVVTRDMVERLIDKVPPGVLTADAEEAKRGTPITVNPVGLISRMYKSSVAALEWLQRYAEGSPVARAEGVSARANPAWKAPSSERTRSKARRAAGGALVLLTVGLLYLCPPEVRLAWAVTWLVLIEGGMEPGRAAVVALGLVLASKDGGGAIQALRSSLRPRLDVATSVWKRAGPRTGR